MKLSCIRSEQLAGPAIGTTGLASYWNNWLGQLLEQLAAPAIRTTGYVSIWDIWLGQLLE